jgi:hypothetical protein
MAPDVAAQRGFGVAAAVTEPPNRTLPHRHLLLKGYEDVSERDPRGQHLRTCEQGPECLEATREAIWQDFATQWVSRELPTTTSSSLAALQVLQPASRVPDQRSQARPLRRLDAVPSTDI